MTRALAYCPGTTVLVVVIGRHPDHPPGGDRPPHLGLVQKLSTRIRDLGQVADFAVWVPEIRAGARWCAYGEFDRADEGVLPDESATVMAAASAAEGHVTFDSREEMARQLQPDEPAALKRRARLLEAAIDALTPELPSEHMYSVYSRVVRAAIDQVRRGDVTFTDDQVVRLAMALSNPPVRDSCLRLALPPAGDRSRHAQRLWLELVRLVPAPARAEPAVLLGYTAYLHGEGPLALMAFDNALEASPDHHLATMLRACLQGGVPPTRLHCLGDRVQDLYRPRSLNIGPRSPGDP